MATYYSSYTGAQLDEAIRKVFNEWPSNTNTTYTQLPVVTTTLADGIRYDSTGGGISSVQYARETQVYSGTNVKQFIYDLKVTTSTTASSLLYIQSAALFTFLDSCGLSSSACIDYISCFSQHNDDVSYACNACISSYEGGSNRAILGLTLTRTVKYSYPVAIRVIVNMKI